MIMLKKSEQDEMSKELLRWLEEDGPFEMKK